MSERGVISTIKGPGFIMSSRRLWLLSIALHRSGHPRIARLVKNFNSILYHNSLPPQVRVSPDIRLGHQGFGTILHPKVVIGKNVKIFHNVTMAVRPPKSTCEIVIEDDVVIGAGAVLMTRRHQGLRIGQGAAVGAGAVVTHDVPPQTIAVSKPIEMRPRQPPGIHDDDDEED
jgi:serine O-acetyltransferase